MQLLGLIRFTATALDETPAWDACERFEAGLPAIGGHLVHREDLQTMVVFDDAAVALSVLSGLLAEGERDGFAVSAGLVQGIRSRAALASALSGFTMGTMETLFDVAACAGLQEVAISPKLSSLVRLAAPEHAARFVPGRHHRPGSRVVAPLVMGLHDPSDAYRPDRQRS